MVGLEYEAFLKSEPPTTPETAKDKPSSLLRIDSVAGSEYEAFLKSLTTKDKPSPLLRIDSVAGSEYEAFLKSLQENQENTNDAEGGRNATGPQRGHRSDGRDSATVTTTDTVTTVNAENTRPELTRSLTAQFQEGLTDFLSHLGDQHGLETNEQPEPPESGQSLVAANSTESSSSTDVALTIQPKISVESITTATATPITTDDSKKKKKKKKNKEPLLLSSSHHSKKKTKT